MQNGILMKNIQFNENRIGCGHTYLCTRIGSKLLNATSHVGLILINRREINFRTIVIKCYFTSPKIVTRIKPKSHISSKSFCSGEG